MNIEQCYTLDIDNILKKLSIAKYKTGKWHFPMIERTSFEKK